MFSRYRMVNPLLGVYYGIVTAAFIGLGLLLLILEYMGLIEQHIAYALTVIALFLSAAIAFASTTKNMDEFFVSGRRVPSGLNGFVILVVALGGAGLSGIVGSIFFWGMEGIGLLLGLLGGVLLAGVLFAGFIRKSGVYSIPSFFQIRFNSRFAGVVAGLFLLIPSFCFAMAEWSLIKMIGPYVFGASAEFCLLGAMVFLLILLVPGGMRSMSWGQCALSIVVVIGLLVPLVLVALKYTNFPFAQFTYGSLIDDVARFEEVGGVPEAVKPLTSLPLIASQAETVQFSFLPTSHVFGLHETVAMFLFVALGMAAMPALLLRASVCSTVFQARKSFAWGGALLGIVILTVPAYVIFLRYLMFDPQAQILTSSPPSWLQALQSMGLFQMNDIDGDGKLLMREMKISRDGVFIALPMLAEFKQTLQSLAFATLLAASFAGLAARMMVLTHLIVRDFNFGLNKFEADVEGVKSLSAMRIGMGVVVIGVGFLALGVSFEPFQMFLAGLLFCAVGLFPVLLLSIWWQAMTKFAMAVGMIIGCCAAAWILMVSDFGAQAVMFDVSIFVAAILAMGAVLFISMVCAKIGPGPSSAELETLIDIRTPGGEALYDRRLRLAMPRRTTGN